jgi:hypothetical protein
MILEKEGVDSLFNNEDVCSNLLKENENMKY